jgi:hypothetical protein
MVVFYYSKTILTIQLHMHFTDCVIRRAIDDPQMVNPTDGMGIIRSHGAQLGAGNGRSQ